MVPHFHSLWGEHPSRESSAAAQEHASTQRETTHTDLPSAKPIAFYHPSAVESNMLLWKKNGFRVCTQAQKERNREQNNRNKVRSESSRSLLREHTQGTVPAPFAVPTPPKQLLHPCSSPAGRSGSALHCAAPGLQGHGCTGEGSARSGRCCWPPGSAGRPHQMPARWPER